MHSLTSCEGREVFTSKVIIKNTILHMNKSNENRQEELLHVGMHDIKLNMHELNLNVQLF